MRRCRQQLLSAGWHQIMGVCISSYSPLGHGFVCTSDLLWFTKEEKSVFMSLNNLNYGQRSYKKICQFLFMYVICVYTYLSIYLFILL